ncbi:16S rRNA (guanine(966)-N(2))-methyltransferase RsmD [Magnetovibrio sp.]|uniref:16S rRNA (guanine(966)-N(2))-methyltransferase RsmD n=1 Tax=Magnetovibrio sp. TaxID=2024836 RepID=UPI002F93A0EA
MRIVGGKHKGRSLAAPQGRDTRPTSDRAREAMFNVLEHLSIGPGIRDARVLDVFAGTGALGLEALSRGALHATFVENHRGAIKTLTANIIALKESDHCAVLPIKATAIPLCTPPHAPVDYAFLDAPYDKGLSVPALHALAERGWLAPEAVIMVEVGAREAFAPPVGFSEVKEKTYGAARAVFLEFRHKVA